ncbi:GNAT family N-acetyltransferase [Paucilactobacillus kaifaensis]|uniref:GNAT family N-acetyltransferase n=1 Tax=Paucilactobacillus kaifaensis TaxID=2559921 RepID=UPI0010F8FC7C|nr:GNAT family N-acetyltransferase [Paucilactobacillus kaifaensis]
MDNEISLAVAEPADAAKVLALLRLLQVESKMFSVTDGFEQLTVDEEKNNLAKINNTTDNLVLLAWNQDDPIGIVTVARTNSKQRSGEVGIAVQKNYWHQGLGTVMMEEVINWGQNFSSLDKLALTVVADNQNAVKLYQKVGFATTAKTSVAGEHGTTLPALLMEYIL